jgi:uncharacterized Ntn-hydrolase superfamily protein
VQTGSGRLTTFLCLVAFVTSSVSFSQDTSVRHDLPVTGYTIIARDSATGDLGIAFLSAVPYPDSSVISGKADVGIVVASGRNTTTDGFTGLNLLEQGKEVHQILDSIVRSDPDAANLQIAVLDPRGNASAVTGSSCLPYSGHLPGYGYCVFGNSLRNDTLLIAVAKAWEGSVADFPDRFLDALAAGEKEGSFPRNHASAALSIFRETGTPSGDQLIDIRIQNDTLPLESLRRRYEEKRVSLLEIRLHSLDIFIQKKQFSTAQIETQRIVGVMNTILREHPDDPEILSRISFLLATYEIDGTRALELARRAVKLAPARTAFRDVEAECLYRLGQIDAAIAIEMELCAKNPSDPGHQSHLARYRAGQKPR